MANCLLKRGGSSKLPTRMLTDSDIKFTTKDNPTSISLSSYGAGNYMFVAYASNYQYPSVLLTSINVTNATCLPIVDQRTQFSTGHYSSVAIAQISAKESASISLTYDGYKGYGASIINVYKY